MEWICNMLRYLVECDYFYEVVDQRDKYVTWGAGDEDFYG